MITINDHQIKVMDHHLKIVMEIMEIMDLHPTMTTTKLQQLCLQELEHMVILCKPTFDQEQQEEIFEVTWQTTMISHL
jgi:hypothetical protein